MKSLMNFDLVLKAVQRFCSLFIQPVKGTTSTPFLLLWESKPWDCYAQRPHPPLSPGLSPIPLPIPVRLHVPLLTMFREPERSKTNWSLVRQIKVKWTSPISKKWEIVLSASATALLWTFFGRFLDPIFWFSYFYSLVDHCVFMKTNC